MLLVLSHHFFAQEMKTSSIKWQKMSWAYLKRQKQSNQTNEYMYSTVGIHT